MHSTPSPQRTPPGPVFGRCAPTDAAHLDHQSDILGQVLRRLDDRELICAAAVSRAWRDSSTWEQARRCGDQGLPPLPFTNNVWPRSFGHYQHARESWRQAGRDDEQLRNLLVRQPEDPRLARSPLLNALNEVGAGQQDLFSEPWAFGSATRCLTYILLADTEAGSIRVVRAAGLQATMTLHAFADGEFEDMALTDDHKKVVVLQTHRVSVWEHPQGRFLWAAAPAPQNRFTSLAVAAGHVFCTDGSLRVWSDEGRADASWGERSTDRPFRAYVSPGREYLIVASERDLDEDARVPAGELPEPQAFPLPPCDIRCYQLDNRSLLWERALSGGDGHRLTATKMLADGTFFRI